MFHKLRLPVCCVSRTKDLSQLQSIWNMTTIFMKVPVLTINPISQPKFGVLSQKKKHLISSQHHNTGLIDSLKHQSTKLEIKICIKFELGRLKYNITRMALQASHRAMKWLKNTLFAAEIWTSMIVQNSLFSRSAIVDALVLLRKCWEKKVALKILNDINKLHWESDMLVKTLTCFILSTKLQMYWFTCAHAIRTLTVQYDWTALGTLSASMLISMVHYL